MRSDSRVAVALPTGVTDQADARAFLQDRIALWALWVCCLSGGFYVVNLLAWPFLLPTGALPEMLTRPSTLLHLSASLSFGAVWLLTRRMQLSLPALRALEVVLLIAGCAQYALMGLFIVRIRQELGGGANQIGLHAGLLASSNVVMARAIAVPSTASRTFWLSAAAMLPVPVAAMIATGGNAAVVINLATWSALAIATATAGSQVIFGLRVEAARVIRQRNQGLAAARNAGLAEARGEFISFLDGDDLIEPSFYDTALALLQRYPHLGAAAAWAFIFGAGVADGYWNAPQPELPLLLVENTVIVPCVMRTSIVRQLGGYDAAQRYNYEDWELAVRLLLARWPIITIPRYLERYRVRGDSLLRTMSPEQHQLMREAMFRKHHDTVSRFAAEIALQVEHRLSAARLIAEPVSDESPVSLA